MSHNAQTPYDKLNKEVGESGASGASGAHQALESADDNLVGKVSGRLEARVEGKQQRAAEKGEQKENKGNKENISTAGARLTLTLTPTLKERKH
jgi:hypothetical protein